MWPLVRLLALLAAALASRRGGLAAPSPPMAPSEVLCLPSSCFALFWAAAAARSFDEAGAACEAGGGHLMTARSTVAADAAAVLLKGRAGGRAWLGLRLPEGACAEPSEALRGFRWVVGDASTDYEAWAGGGWTSDGAGGGVCGPRCVAVNGAQAWEVRPCDAAVDGFLCEYSYPGGTCAPLQPPPAAASYLVPFGGREDDLAALPPGTLARVPGLGAELECRARPDGSLGWASASPGAWNCSLANGGCDGQCLWSDRGEPLCLCPDGEALLEEDRRSCHSACDALGCEHLCQPQGTSGICMCLEGFKLDQDGRSCKDVDDCKLVPGPCEQECVNTQGSFECRCFEDYELVDSTCKQKGWQCHELQCEDNCRAVDGEYRCVCTEPYAPDPNNPSKCVLFCNATKCPAMCDPNTQDGCLCAEHYVWEQEPDGTQVCSDIDECASDVCKGLECVNTPGSYYCFCPEGQVCQPPTEEPGPDPDPEQSGDIELSTTESFSTVSLSTLVPPTTSSSQGMLVAIIVSSVFTVIVLLLVLGYLVRRYYTAQSKMDYKCQQSETGVALCQVSPSTASQREKM